jgi:cell pole-organizing protein PopZ
LNEDEQAASADETPAEPLPDKPGVPGDPESFDDDVLVLDQSMMVAAPAPEPTRRGDDPAEPPPQVVEAPVAQPAPVSEAAEAVPQPAPLPQAASDLVAPEAAAAAALSVGSLMRTLAAGRSTQVYSGGPTLEDMVRAELRPLLKQWLDEYLPPLVERLVRTEIERVVSRAVP